MASVYGNLLNSFSTTFLSLSINPFSTLFSKNSKSDWLFSKTYLRQNLR